MGVAVVGLELGGRDGPDLAVEPPVVEPVDVFGDSDLDVVDALPGAFVADHSALNNEFNASAIALS